MSTRLVFGALVVLLVFCRATPREDDFVNYIAPPPLHTNEVKYHYRYGVDDAATGVFTHKWEERFGAYVKGAYSLLEPDGRVRIVDYEVDGPKGFHAVIRTTPPGQSYLSFRQLSMSRQSHGAPPVNILTNNPNKPTDIEPQTPKKFIAKDLPPNFHSVKPDYFWGDLPHDYFTHGKGKSEHDRPSPNVHDHSQNSPNVHDHSRNSPNVHDHSRNSPNDHSRPGHAHTSHAHDHEREFPNPAFLAHLHLPAKNGQISNEVRHPNNNRQTANTRTWRDAGQPPRDFMTPPNHNAKVMSYDRLKPGVITDVIYNG